MNETDKLYQANIILQERLKIKELEIISIKQELSKYIELYDSVLKDNLMISSVIPKIKEEISIKQKVHNNGEGKKKGLKQRKLIIDKILKHPDKYNLTDIDLSFINQIKRIDVLSEKQMKWYKDILKKNNIN